MIRFMTRIPVPESTFPHIKPDFTTMAYALPIAGVIAALPAAILGYFALSVGLSPTIVAVLILCALMLATGGLHEDGLADVFDGLGGGKTREDKLEIMRDSRIGAYGTLALIMSSMLRVGLLAAIISQVSSFGLVCILLAAAGFSRASLVWCWSALPAARDDGLSNRYGFPDTNQFWLAAGVAAIACLPMILFALPVMTLPTAIILTGGPLWFFANLCRSQIGGHTGDVLGACQIIAEALFYLALLIAVGN